MDLFKLKDFPDDNKNVSQTVNVILGKVENILRKQNMLVTSIFSFPIMVKIMNWLEMG